MLYYLQFPILLIYSYLVLLLLLLLLSQHNENISRIDIEEINIHKRIV